MITPARRAASACCIATRPAGRSASAANTRRANGWNTAVKAAPDYPENHLNLAESCLRWKDRDQAERQLNALDALWSKARTNFAGEAWERSWADWSPRRDAARKKLVEMTAPARPPKK